ncbi:MAG: pyruvate kinase [Campylobacterales bacterium]|nr:pyruvate kinase [Campylobacterales bacterium]
MRRTKIVVTVGPSTDSLEKIKELITAGVNVFRLNFSHGSHESHKKTIEIIRQAEKELGKYVAILQDISGPKIRVGEIDGELQLKKGEIWYLSCEEELGDNEIPFKNPTIINDIKEESLVYFADGTIRAKALGVENDKAKLEILVGGKLTSRKGVNFPDLTLSIDVITEKDKKDIEFGVKNGVDFAAISFVQKREDIELAREVASKFGRPPLFIPKIEKKDAVANLEDILSVSDGVMVARGDLGVELGVELVPKIQKKIIKVANYMGKPAITATQMLTSMIKSPYPTRAEVSDVANAVLDGTDAVMLSDETAVGDYPLECISVLDKSIHDIEKIYPFHKQRHDEHTKIDAVASSVDHLSESLLPAGIVVFTLTGSSAKKVAQFRPESRIIATTSDIDTVRHLNLVWGVRPTYLDVNVKDVAGLIKVFSQDAVERKYICKERTYIYVIGHPIGEAGSTNVIRIIEPNYWRTA